MAENNTLQGKSARAKTLAQRLFRMIAKRIGKDTVARTADPETAGLYRKVFDRVEETVVDHHSGGNNKETSTATKIRKSGRETNATDGETVPPVVSHNRSVYSNETDREIVGRDIGSIVGLFETEIAANSKELVKRITSLGAGGLPREATAKFVNRLALDGATVSNLDRGATRFDVLDPADWKDEIALASEIRGLVRGYRGKDSGTGEEKTADVSRAEQDEHSREEATTADLNKAEKAAALADDLDLIPACYFPKKYAAVIRAAQAVKREAYKAANEDKAPSKEMGRRLDGEAALEWVETHVSNAVKLATVPAKKGKKAA